MLCVALADAMSLPAAGAHAPDLDPPATLTVGWAPIVAASLRPNFQSDCVDPSIISEVCRVIRPHLPVSWRERELDQNLTLGADGLALDSVSLLDAVLALEDAFRVELPIERLSASAPTLGGLVHLVAETLAARQQQ